MKELETKSAILLKPHLKARKLPPMTAECAEVAARRAQEDVDHLGFLLPLSAPELRGRERRAAARRLKSAKLPAAQGRGAFAFAAAPSINNPIILELL